MPKPTTTIAYADCFSGVSGDMFLGALLAAGLPEEILHRELAALPLTGYTLDCHRHHESSHLQATQFTVVLHEPQPHRDWLSIEKLLRESQLAAGVKRRALAVFALLAEAEAAVHGCRKEEIHFHEVGGVDALVDIVGAAIGLEYLGIDELHCSPLPMPTGWTSAAHGQLPLPAPAVCELLKGVPVYGVELRQELVTPTGAALMKALCSGFGPFPTMTISGVGYGAGSRQREDQRPNLLRLVIGEQRQVNEAQEVEIIESNLDDLSPEAIPYLSDQLFAQGALDVIVIPILMKKGRPGFTVQIIAPPECAVELRQCLLRESSAIGLRYRRENRCTLPRQLGTIPTPWGPLQVKQVEGPGGPVLYPEYEDCQRLARLHGLPLRAVYNAVAASPLNSFTAAKTCLRRETF